VVLSRLVILPVCALVVKRRLLPLRFTETDSLGDSFRVAVKGRDLSACLAMNLVMVTRHPFWVYTSFSVAGEGIDVIAKTFSGLARSSSLVITTPRNFPSSTPNEHFPGLSLMLYARCDTRKFQVTISLLIKPN
jgi:hypothetical protein